ncbi:MAG TPA: hypothetical protein VFG88_00265 [Nocardioidaceae bacterium]|nr:hypothetical protein [Nocardioidaceae bacterium]
MADREPTEQGHPARPRQVTLAGWAAVVCSALLVVTLFDAMGQIHSVEMRRTIEEFLSTSPGSGLGLQTGDVVGLLRVMLLVAGAVAAAAVVLSVYVLQRHRGARIGLTIAAVALLATTPVTASPFVVVVAAAAISLWTGPARDWFAGRSPRPRHAGEPSATSADQRTSLHARDPEKRSPLVSHEQPSDPTQPRMPDSEQERPVPPPTQGFGSQPAQQPAQQPGQESGQESEQQSTQQPEQPQYRQAPYGQPPYGQPQYGQPGYSQQPGYPVPGPAQGGYPPAYGTGPGGYPGHHAGGSSDPDRRPTTVTAAAWITWVLAGLTTLAFGLVMLVMLVARDEFVRAIESQPEFADAGFGSGQLLGWLWVAAVVVVLWCLAAIVLGVLAFRRQNWARITLVVSASVSALFSLVSITSVISAFTLIGSGLVIALLFTGGANDWYARRGYGAAGGPGSTGGYPAQAYGYSGQYPAAQQPAQYPGAQQGGQYPGQYPGQPTGGQHGAAYPGPYGGSYPGQYGGQSGQQGQQGQSDRPGQQQRPGQGEGRGQPESGDKSDPPSNVW